MERVTAMADWMLACARRHHPTNADSPLRTLTDTSSRAHQPLLSGSAGGGARHRDRARQHQPERCPSLGVRIDVDRAVVGTRYRARDEQTGPKTIATAILSRASNGTAPRMERLEDGRQSRRRNRTVIVNGHLDALRFTGHTNGDRRSGRAGLHGIARRLRDGLHDPILVQWPSCRARSDGQSTGPCLRPLSSFVRGHDEVGQHPREYGSARMSARAQSLPLHAQLGEVMRKWVGEALGTFILVFGGCGTAVFAAKFPSGRRRPARRRLRVRSVRSRGGLRDRADLGRALQPRGVGWAGVRGSFLLARAPRLRRRAAVWCDRGRCARSGARIGQPGGYDVHTAGLAANGFGAHSPGSYSLGAGLFGEVVLTFIFLSVILGATSKSATTAQAGIAIGLTLTLIHLIGIPRHQRVGEPGALDGAGAVRRRLGAGQLWLFWLAPIVGAALAGVLCALPAGRSGRGACERAASRRARCRCRASRPPNP